jgi:hypothetical protein
MPISFIELGVLSARVAQSDHPFLFQAITATVLVGMTDTALIIILEWAAMAPVATDLATAEAMARVAMVLATAWAATAQAVTDLATVQVATARAMVLATAHMALDTEATAVAVATALVTTAMVPATVLGWEWVAMARTMVSLLFH